MPGQAAEEAWRRAVGSVEADRTGDDEYRVVRPYENLPDAQRLVELTGRYHLAAGEDRWADKLAAFLSGRSRHRYVIDWRASAQAAPASGNKHHCSF